MSDNARKHVRLIRDVPALSGLVIGTVFPVIDDPRDGVWIQVDDETVRLWSYEFEWVTPETTTEESDE